MISVAKVPSFSPKNHPSSRKSTSKPLCKLGPGYRELGVWRGSSSRVPRWADQMGTLARLWALPSSSVKEDG